MLHRISGVEAVQQDIAYLWYLALKSAIAEADPRLARTKIETAEVALFRRIHAFTPGPNAMFDALSTIRSLKARAVRFAPRKTASRLEVAR